MDIVSNALKLAPRVLNGLDAIQRGRFEEKELWNVPLSVLDEETRKLTLVRRKALAVSKVLSEMPIRIERYELIVGFSVHNSVANITPFPEYATQEERAEAAGKYTGTFSVFGHFCPSYPKVLRLGVGGLRRQAEEKLSEIRRNGGDAEKEDWIESAMIALDGLKDFMLRYGGLASELSDSEVDPSRKEELREIARISNRLSREPPCTFREALQALWFAHIAFESTLNFMSMGRFDQNLWPYLKHDLENHVITLEEAQELVDCLWLKFNDRLQTFELASRNVNTSYVPMTEDEIVGTVAGIWGLYLGGNTTHDRLAPLQGSEFSTWLQTMPLSGLTPEGKDGTNPLTYLCINATRRLKLPQPSIYVRLHDGSPAELYERAADCIQNSNGPCIYNDEVVVPALSRQGLPIEDARDYTTDGCWETFIQGKTQFRYGVISAPEALDRALFPGRWDEEAVPLKYIRELDPFTGSELPDPMEFKTYEELWSSFKEQLGRYIRGMIETADDMMDGRLYDIAPLPLISACTEGPLETGTDITRGGIEYSFYAPILGGLSHAADSLAAIKKLCFEEKLVGWADLLEGLKKNWEGKEPLRKMVMTRAPAYGNDIDAVDEIAREIVEFYVNETKKYGAKAKNKALFNPGVGTFEHYVAMGAALPATPDGRLPGQPVASNASPTNGRATNGQTAMINSYVKLPLGDLPTGAPLDIGMDTRSGHLLEPMIKSFIEKRGNMLSISVNDVEKLKAALKEPEKYRDLKIRIGGWEAFFVDLPPAYQEWQIKKYEQHGG
jgi:formate C-acetyltransferase